MGQIGLEDIEDVPIFLAVPFIIMLCFIILFTYFMFSVDTTIKRDRQEEFQDGISYALRAYSTCYTKDLDNLSSISEGYIIDEDIIIYGQNSNSLTLDYTKASNYFFNIMELNTKLTAAEIKTRGLFIINITTSFTPNEKYKVTILRNGNDIMTVSGSLSTIYEVENFIESKLNVSIDIATDFNASIRKAQKYAMDKGYFNTSDSNSSNVYSSYTTNMCIAKNIPVRGIFGQDLVDIHEMQTYSLIRKES